MADGDTKRLLLTIDASVELLKRNLRQGDDHVARFERDTKRRLATIDRSFAGMGRGVDTLTQRFNVFRGALAGLGIAFGAGTIIAAGKAALDYAADMGEAARAIGVTVEQYQILTRAAIENGASQEGMTRSLGILNRTLGQARAGVPAAVQAFRALRIDPEQFTRAGDVLPTVMARLRALRTESEQSAAAARLFGRGAAELIPFLVQGAEGYNRVAEAARRAGLLTAEQAAQADAAKDALAELALTIRTRLGIAIIDLIPQIQQAAAGLETLFEPFADNAETQFQRISTGLHGLARDISMLLHEFQDAGNNLGNFGEAILRFLDPGLARRLVGTPETQGQRQFTFADRYDRASADRSLDQQLDQTERRNARGGYRRDGGPFLSYSPTRGGSARDTGDDALDLAGTSATRERQRTDRQVYNDFLRELRAEGFNPSADQGHRSRATQARMFRELGPGNAAPPGSSDHEAWKAFDFSAGADREAIRRAAARAGVRLGEPLVHGRQRHLHQTFSDARGQGGGEEEQARLAERALREQFAFDSEIRRGHSAVLGLRRDMETDLGERSRLSNRMLDIDKEQELAAIAMSVTLGDRTQAQADQLAADVNTADALRRQQVAIEEQTRRRDAVDQLLTQRAEIQRSLLEGEAELATTQAERRRIELLILQHSYDEERGRLQRVIAESRDADERERAQERLGAMSAQYAQRQEVTRRNTRGPLEEYLDALPNSTDEINEQLQRIEVRALESLTQEFGAAAAAALGLSGSIGQVVASLAELAIQQAILAIFGGGGGGLFGSLLGGGGGITIPGKADGGPVAARRLYMVGERGPELFVPKLPGTIVPNHALGGGGITVHVHNHINAPGADPAQLQRVVRALEAHHAALPATIVGVVQDAVARRMIR